MCANTSCVESCVDTENRFRRPEYKKRNRQLSEKYVYVQSVDDRVVRWLINNRDVARLDFRARVLQ